MKIYNGCSKKKNIKKHFFYRCLERLGLYIDRNDIIKKIQKNELQFLHRTSNNRTLFKYKCSMNNKNYIVVYDKRNHDVVTIFPYRERRKDI